MKELSIEQKAAAYDDALDRAKGVIEQNPLMEYLKKGIEYIFPELKESEDERIRKALIEHVKGIYKGCCTEETSKERDMFLTWLEKQGEHANFRNKIEIGDKVTRNEDGVLVNLSQLNRVAKKDKKQCEQKPWSEEDEYCRHQLIAFCENCMAQDACSKRCANWLKSFKDRYTWKPSDEQMDALRYVTNFDYGGYKATLVSLYEQLKKLRGE